MVCPNVLLHHLTWQVVVCKVAAFTAFGFFWKLDYTNRFKFVWASQHSLKSITQLLSAFINLGRWNSCLPFSFEIFVIHGWPTHMDLCSLFFRPQGNTKLHSKEITPDLGPLWLVVFFIHPFILSSINSPTHWTHLLCVCYCAVFSVVPCLKILLYSWGFESWAQITATYSKVK